MERKTNWKNGSRFKRFLNGRGFYAALVVCLLAVGGVSVATFGERIFVSDKADSSEPSSGTKPVEQLVTNQPDDRKTTTTTFSSTRMTTTTAPRAVDLYVFPLSNTVQKAYSGEALAYSETMGDWRVHEGTDFVGESGQTVKALADGEVKAVFEDLIWGGIVEIDHGVGVISRYCGVTASVKAGSSVKVGDPIGQLSTVPCEEAQGAHLHMELTVDGAPVNPVEAIGRDVRYEAQKTPD